MSATSYKDAGVDLELYADSMARLPKLLHRTYSPRVMKLDGGFAGLYQLDFDSPLFARKYQQPVLVGCKDGVGTKLIVAQQAGRHDSVGIDLVAMCVNDALCCGAEPLFFMDYVAMGKDNPPLLEQLVEGISNGCVEADCALLGGETAIMPDLYRESEYDMSGTCIGVVEKKQILDGKAIAPGDVAIGLASSGLHSNGFSLVRKIVFEKAGLKLDDPFPATGKPLSEELLRPTQIYVRPLRAVHRHYRVKHVVHGAAHITGGGLFENITRIMPEGVRLLVDRNSWEVPAVFPWLAELGQVESAEMDRVFNMGLGMVLIVAEFYANNIQRLLEDNGVKNWRIGQTVAGPLGVDWA
ncbi:phosphoribosylformylglycinamidine cyclo-ligase [Lignipirellula cremea]|uniref:Phosphoribosylformylglycinamidine cyclo-ligase n=1 Tax=Lignipirellula cremea TaxID=2528010 RepID=A0A518DNR4_9BACT|nr:phosphoribosylformylglycinamidine cyclo-ligase [Lignipirellula cremea]QDU93478.1 Phosphoribosylformylglycinamidine cyclo-ligase [Lignipirellula cremea]